MKILIVDDEGYNRMLLEKILRPFGAIAMATNGIEAVEAFKQGQDAGAPFNLVLMDIMMPDMSGQEALQEIRRLEKAVSGTHPDAQDFSFIIMQTALDDPKYLVESFFKGQCDEYITKPFTSEELLAKLKQHGLI